MSCRSLMRILCAALLMSAAASCASTEAYEKALQQWVGKHVDALVTAWGPPQGSHRFEDGHQVIQYVDRRTQYQRPWTTYNSETGNREIIDEGYFHEFTCITTFETDTAGIVKSWSWKGNGCAIAPEN